MLRPAHLVRHRLLVLLVTVFTSATLGFYYYLNAFPSELAVSASRYFSPAVPLADSRILKAQAAAYAMGGVRPVCPLQDWHEARYAPLRDASKNVFIAANLYNSENILPTFFQELPVLIEHLGKESVFVSVYESNSKDRTPEMLQLLEGVLFALGVPHTIVYAKQDDKPPGTRIEMLADVRNRALDPLYTGEAAQFMPGEEFDEILFMNDIAFCAADMLELLLEKRVQGANQACTVDYMEAVIYDRWVLRDIHGKPFYRWQDVSWFYKILPAPFLSRFTPPLPDDPAAAKRFASNLPVQVFSCWNGAVALDADVFAQEEPEGIRFRVAANSEEGGKDAAGEEAVASDRSSECFLISVDMWKARRGKVMVVPKASVSYDTKHYHTYRKDYIRPADDAPRIEWVRDPPAKVAMQDFGAWKGPERWAPWDEQ
ncbi:glycosyltransferase family 69 protein [Peniophora sp. CONT]|nr:glycosyltransferase family 69 protein [Peniophora sp. CONT]